MTLIYDKLPTQKEGFDATTPEVDAWESTNPPIVTIRVWLGRAEGEAPGVAAVLTRIQWSEEAQAGGDAVCRPLEEMAAAMRTVHGMVHQIEGAIAVAAIQREALNSATKH